MDDLKVSWQGISKILHQYNAPSDTLRQFTWKFKLPYWDYLLEKGVSRRVAKGKRIPRMFIRFYKRFSAEINPFPEVHDVLSELSKRGIKIAIVSQTPKEIILHMLKRHGIDKSFDECLGLGDYKEPKPSPESILKVLDKLKVKPDEAMYVGDMSEDVVAAIRSGVVPVAVNRRGSYHPKRLLKKYRPFRIIKNLKEILFIIE